MQQHHGNPPFFAPSLGPFLVGEHIVRDQEAASLPVEVALGIARPRTTTLVKTLGPVKLYHRTGIMAEGLRVTTGVYHR